MAAERPPRVLAVVGEVVGDMLVTGSVSGSGAHITLELCEVLHGGNWAKGTRSVFLEREGEQGGWCLRAGEAGGPGALVAQPQKVVATLLGDGRPGALDSRLVHPLTPFPLLCPITPFRAVGGGLAPSGTPMHEGRTGGQRTGRSELC